MTTEVEVKIDSTTGLPELPEGMFWRVADDKQWGDDPTVFLMERKLTDVRKMRTFFGLDLGLGFKYVEEMTDVVVSSRGFDGATLKPDEIPAGSTIRAETFTGKGTIYRYTEPVNEKTIAARALDIMKMRKAQEEGEKEWERVKAKRQEVKDKFYGDYPPKTLIG